MILFLPIVFRNCRRMILLPLWDFAFEKLQIYLDQRHVLLQQRTLALVDVLPQGLRQCQCRLQL
jgi:hypothetical protein